MHVCRMLWVHTNVRIGIVHTCGHVSVFCSSFCSSVRCFCSPVCASYDCISLCSSFYLSSVHLSDIPSVRPSVCLSACMFTCTYIETNALVYVLWTSNIELTDTLSGLSRHWTFILFGWFFVSRFKRRHCRYVHIFMLKLCLRSPKKVHIYL